MIVTKWSRTNGLSSHVLHSAVHIEHNQYQTYCSVPIPEFAESYVVVRPSQKELCQSCVKRFVRTVRW